MALTPTKISDDLKQAFWRLALNGNTYWTKYYSSGGQPPGTNDKQATVGHVSSTGRKTFHEAGKPYHFTEDMIDAQKRGFGFWSRSDETIPTYRFAAFDIEPLLHEPRQHVNHNPTSAEKRVTLSDALAISQAVGRLAKTRTDILWRLVVESSPDHYHVWALFEQPISEQVHRDFVDEVLITAGTILNLDKSTNRATNGMGDQFRAPWSWKHGRRSEAIFSRICDEALVLKLAREALPREAHLGPSLNSSSRRNLRLLWKPQQGAERNGNQATSAGAGLPDDAALNEKRQQYLRDKFPIHGPGMRNRVQCKLVAHLVNKKLDDEQIVQAGSLWLRSFETKIGTRITEAIQLLRECLQRTRNNAKFNARRPPDYGQIHCSTVLTPADEAFLAGIVESNGQLVLSLDDADAT